MQVARVVCRMCDSIWPAAVTLFAPCLPYRVPLMRRQPSARTDGQEMLEMRMGMKDAAS